MHRVINYLAEIRIPLPANRETRNVVYLLFLAVVYPLLVPPSLVRLFCVSARLSSRAVTYRLYQTREGPVPIRTLLLL